MNLYVAIYIYRNLFTFPVSTIMFYIYQLLQLLRYDKMNYFWNYIKEMSKISTVIMHQLIWYLKAESKIDGDGSITYGFTNLVFFNLIFQS